MTNIQKYRKAAGLTQRELADLSGIKLRTVQDYELGRRSIGTVSINTGARLSAALKIPLYQIVDDPEISKLLKEPS